jgi:hypothetical protein
MLTMYQFAALALVAILTPMVGLCLACYATRESKRQSKLHPYLQIQKFGSWRQ